MDFEQIAQGMEDAPEQSFPVKPEVWCQGTIETAEERQNTYVDPAVDEINLRLRIVASAHDAAGKEAKGVEFARLCAPPKEHASFSEKRRGYMLGNYAKALTAIFAPGVKDQKQAKSQAMSALRAGGVNAFVGKSVLFKLSVNDGTDKKTGEVKNQKRADDPRNEVSNWMADTPENLAKYVTAATNAKSW